MVAAIVLETIVFDVWVRVPPNAPNKGKVAEWFIASVLKTGKGETLREWV